MLWKENGLMFSTTLDEAQVLAKQEHNAYTVRPVTPEVCAPAGYRYVLVPALKASCTCLWCQMETTPLDLTDIRREYTEAMLQRRAQAHA
jgi:hypothetical protein